MTGQDGVVAVYVTSCGRPCWLLRERSAQGVMYVLEKYLTISCKLGLGLLSFGVQPSLPSSTVALISLHAPG